MVIAAGVTADVEEGSLCVSTLKTVDNRRVWGGNGRIVSGNIVNNAHNGYCRVDLQCLPANKLGLREVIAKLKSRLASIPKVAPSPAPDVEFNAADTLPGARLYCLNSHYWQVF